MIQESQQTILCLSVFSSVEIRLHPGMVDLGQLDRYQVGDDLMVVNSIFWRKCSFSSSSLAIRCSKACKCLCM